MAIANSDGSIILSTKVDASGLNKGMSQMEGKTSGLTKAFSKLGAAITAAFAVQKLVQFGQEAINLASDLQEVQNVVDTAFGSMAYKIEDFSKTAIERFGLSELAAKQWASTMMAMGSGMGQSMEIGSDMAVELTGRLADVMSFYNKTEEEAFTLGKAIYSGETEPLKSIGIIMTENNLSLFAMSKGYQQAYKDMDAANKLLVRQQFFLEQTSLAAGDYTKTADGWANQTRTLSQRWKEMQATFGETFITLGVLVLPVIEAIIEGLNQVALMAKAAALSFGLFKEEAKTTDKNAENFAKESDKTAENIKKQADNQKNLNKEMKNTLAGFDDIQILSANTANNTSIGSQDIGGNLGGNAPDGSAYVEEIDETLTAIMSIVALSLVAVGLILLFTGNIGWGIGFIISGAATLTVTMASASKFEYDGIIQMLTTVMGVAGGALLALGIILLWMGGIVGKGVAVGMIIAGGALIVSAVVAQAAFSPDDVGGWLALITGIAAGALLALGVILCMVGTIPLGVGMIIAGSVSLVSAVALNSDAVVEAIRGPIGIITAIVSGALLVLGIILTCSGILPLGIGLIAAGAIGLATVAAINWNAIVEALQGTIGTITAIASGALLVLGIILVCTGVGMPLGIGLILAGAAGLATVAAVNWNGIVDNIKQFLFENPLLVSLISGGLLVLGIVLCVAGILPLGIGLIAAGAIGLAAEVALNWDAIVTNIRSFLFENPVLVSLISGGLLILGIILCFVPSALPLAIGLIVAGAAGLATEVALHWDTIVTNIRQYLFENSELISMISGGLLILGIILCVTGVGIPLGLGMIIAGAAGLASVVAVNWSSIVDWVKNAWNAVKNFWNAHIAPVFTAKWWLDLGKTCINGLIAGFEGGINGIISAFESMINWIVDGLNKISFDIPDWLGGGSFGINLPRANFGRVKIPRLAQGAVIPPNREFLAVLGDQKQGTNIETPLATMIEAFQMALDSRGGYNGGNTEVILEIDGREFGRAVVEQGNRENRRIGTRLVIG